MPTRSPSTRILEWTGVLPTQMLRAAGAALLAFALGACAAGSASEGSEHPGPDTSVEPGRFGDGESSPAGRIVSA